MDYEEFLSISDFIKPAMFSNPAGWRFHRCTQALRSSVLYLFHLIIANRKRIVE